MSGHCSGVWMVAGVVRKVARYEVLKENVSNVIKQLRKAFDSATTTAQCSGALIVSKIRFASSNGVCPGRGGGWGWEGWWGSGWGWRVSILLINPTYPKVDFKWVSVLICHVWVV